jgi:hypothetical protein
MRLTQFWELMRAEFGDAYAAHLAGSHVLSVLGGRTVQAALDAGEHPRLVWLALCDDMEVPAERRLGPVHRAPAGEQGRG